MLLIYLSFYNLPSLVQSDSANCRTSMRLLGCYDHLNSNSGGKISTKSTPMWIGFSKWTTSNRKEKHTNKCQQTRFPVSLNGKTEENTDVDINTQVCAPLCLSNQSESMRQRCFIEVTHAFYSESSDITCMSSWKRNLIKHRLWVCTCISMCLYCLFGNWCLDLKFKLLQLIQLEVD